ncbi:SMP-30/gluconolactonase/LRE family protein [Sphingomonas sp. KR1UV-12]|uniref:SMP-30/gluconolactonase/LRE family protein n=1 Tax=Sphingomonas aurea TaxID=3063994 RepID=A0ABT9EL98_9SPHN|nr:SMP-30/gluconolactonase/LRE family protein [Sphingomonas sp. KR1UV-12]MDP1027620.1 SMP-30/gluconolactonase/LRE family protein [Sphingomonas sp. KR1UV-12]
MTAIRFLGDHRAKLGESPVWDHRSGWLWWVDALAGLIHAATPDGQARARFQVDQPVGSIGLADGGLIAALADGFHHLDMRTGATRPIRLLPADPTLRLNDGKADRAGRFLSAQAQVHGTGAVPSRGGLWRLDADGEAERLAGGLEVGNAICFAPDGRTLYFADSLDGFIRAHAYDPVTGAIGERRDLIDCRTLGSGPDGATVDAQGNLWVALVLAQQVACISPRGEVLRRIDLPIPYPACPAFGGPGRATLYVTTIADSGHRLRSDHPDAGRVLAIEGLGATGLAEGVYHIRE